MRIVDIDFVLLTGPHQTPQRLRSYGVAVVRTEDGLTGVGEPYAAVNLPRACREAALALKPLFVGRDSQQYVQIINHAQATVEYFDHGGMMGCLLGAFDWALHDLAAQHAGLPLHRFLNPNSQPSVELYASTGLAKWSVAAVVDDLKQRIDEGFQTIKIRVGCGIETVNDALIRARAAVNCVGRQARLGIDAGQQVFVQNRWSRSDVNRLVQGLATTGIAFLEDPYLITDMGVYQELCQHPSPPIAGGEMFNDPSNFERYFAGRALHIAQPDASVIPGPAKTLSVLASTRRHGINLIMHAWAGPVAQLQNVHAALAGGCDLVEHSVLFHPLLHEGLAPAWQFQNGRLAAPQAAGMGTTPIDILERKYPFQNTSNLVA